MIFHFFYFFFFIFPFFTQNLSLPLSLSLSLPLYTQTFYPANLTPTTTTSINNFDAGLNSEVTDKIQGFSIYNRDNCVNPSDPTSIAFSWCRPDEYCTRQSNGLQQPAISVQSAPPCVPSSTCECETHRWPIGTLLRGPAIALSPTAVCSFFFFKLI